MTLTWRSLVLLAVGLVAFGLRPQASTVWWWWLFVALVLLLDWALAPSPTRLGMVRRGPGQVLLGRSSATTLFITNPDRVRRVRGLVRDAWPPSAGASPRRHTLDVRAGERVALTTVLTPTRRGDREADRVTVRVNGPLGLAARQVSMTVPGTVRALHPFGAIRHLPSRLNLLRQLDGRSAVRTRGQGTEFDSLRDYVDGDDVRSIDWRATARRQNLVVRTWQPEQHRRVVIVVDSSRTSAGRVGDFPRLDAAMDAALLLTALATRAHDDVEVVTGDRFIRARLRGSEPAAMLAETVQSLSRVDAALVEADWPLLVAEVGRRGNRRGLVVLLTTLEASAVEEGLLPVLPSLLAHHRVVVAAVADPAVTALRQQRDDLAAVYDAAAAEHATSQRTRTAEALGRMGVHVIDADADDLPPALADHYLSLKANGLL